MLNLFKNKSLSIFLTTVCFFSAAPLQAAPLLCSQVQLKPSAKQLITLKDRLTLTTIDINREVTFSTKDIGSSRAQKEILLQWQILDYEQENDELDRAADAFLPELGRHAQFYPTIRKIQQFQIQYSKAVDKLLAAENEQIQDPAEIKAGIESKIDEVIDLRIHDAFLKSAIITYDNNVGNIAGHWRVYDGTQYRRPISIGYNDPQKTILPLPRERFLQRMGKTTTTYDNLRKQGQYRLLELGKYVLNPDLDHPTRKLVKKELYAWLIENYLSEEQLAREKVLLILDPITEERRQQYIELWGARAPLASDFTVDFNETPDNVLFVDGRTMKKHLLDYINKP